MSHKFAVEHGFQAPSEVEDFYTEMHTSVDQSWSDYVWSFLGY